MSWNTIRCNFDLAAIGVPCNPDKLADLIILARSKKPSAYKSHLSDDGLRELIKLAYYGSQKSEEGRYPNCRFFAYPTKNKNDQLHTSAVFDPPIGLDLMGVRKLAPIAPRKQHALVVNEDGEKLWVTRIMSMSSKADINGLGRPEFWASLDIPFGLMITIEGPGALQVSESGVTLRFRAGRIEESIPVMGVDAVSEWYSKVEKELHQQVVQKNPYLEKYFGGTMHMFVAAVWSQVLEGCVSEHHGGAFVIIDPDKCDGNLQLKYHLREPDLGQAMCKFWLESASAVDGKDHRNLERWLRLYNLFRKQIDVVSSLGNVDGCVCLSPTLKVLGFGSEILVDEKSADESSLVLIDAKTKKPRDSQCSRQFGGTRHRSAYRLCKKVSNVLVFVISQDGDLSLFYSNDKSVYAFGSLGSWLSNPDLQ